MNFTTKDLQTILYSLEGYMQGNDDTELVEDLEGICYRIQRQIEVQVWTIHYNHYHKMTLFSWKIV